MQLDNILGVLGIPETEIPITKNNVVNLYTHPGKYPVARLFLNGNKFTIRFGEAILPTAFYERNDDGGMKFTPVKLSLLLGSHHH